MNRVSITNPDLTKQETTKLIADATAGSDVALAVKNNQGYAVDELIIIKRAGREKCEKEKITVITGNTGITVATLKLNHLEDEEIRKVPYDQIKLYSCATEDGTYVEVAAWSDINFDDLVTYIDHAAGTDDTWYKSNFKHSVSARESGLSDSFQITADTHYCSINDILEEAGMKDNKYIEPARVYHLRASAEAEVKASISVIYALPLDKTCELTKIITKLLSAGWLMWQEYGEEASGTDKDGIAKIKEARSMLKGIRNHTLILLDADDTEPSKITKPMGQVDGWPDSTTKDADDDEGGGDVKFRVTDEF